MTNFRYPPILTIDNAKVLHLFTGENFYSDCDAALREAVLNAIDAVNRRRADDSSIKPDIEVIFSKSEQRIHISDNGDGMDQEAVATLFTRVGASASRFITAGQRAPASAIGEFGIGALSYFLVGDEYLLNSVKSGCEPVGLKLSVAMLDGNSAAEQIACHRTEVGTTLTLIIKTPEIFDRLRERFQHWVRNVEGLVAIDADTNMSIPQGGLTNAIRKVNGLSTPEWILRAEIGPPQDVALVGTFDGKGRVDVLYHGVFVERLEIDRLWGIEGAVHVDPKHFRPKLNREGFVGQHLRSELELVLRTYHPLALKELVVFVRQLLADKQNWSAFRAITLWLAVPREQAYAEAAALWDREFRSYKAFRLLSADDDTDASIEDIVALKAPKLFIAPDRIDANSLSAQAIRVLRAQGPYQTGFILAVIAASTGLWVWAITGSFKACAQEPNPSDWLTRTAASLDATIDLGIKVAIALVGAGATVLVGFKQTAMRLTATSKLLLLTALIFFGQSALAGLYWKLGLANAWGAVASCVGIG